MTNMIRWTLLTLALVGSPLLPVAAQRSGGPGAVCMPVDSLLVPVTLAGLQRVVTDPGQEAAATRQLRKLPQTSASQVTYVTDNAVCASAAQTYSANVGSEAPASPSGSVYVFKIKDVYMVADTAQRVGEYLITMTLSKQFKLLVKYLQ